MRYLLDTNILVFLLSGNRGELSADIQDIIFNFSNILFISSVSIIELCYLFDNNKVKFPYKNKVQLLEAVDNDYYLQILHTKPEHLKTCSELQIAENHKDQIDHFIISQAICEKMPLVSSDRKFREYRTQNLDFVYNKR